MGRRLEMPPQCIICGKYNPEYADFCEKCLWHKTWRDAIRAAWDPDQVRVKGHLWVIHPEPPKPPRYRLPPTGGRGMAGQRFRIQFNDGRIVTTRNLWSVGDIPREYREALPDNAKFIERKGVTRRKK